MMKKIFKKFLVASVAAGSFIFNPPVNDLNITPTAYAEEKKSVFDELPVFDSAKNISKDADLNSKEILKYLQESFKNATPLERQVLNTLF